jgi:hypothetical protein
MKKTLTAILILTATMAMGAIKYEPNIVYFQTNVYLADNTNLSMQARLPTGNVITVSGGNINASGAAITNAKSLTVGIAGDATSGIYLQSVTAGGGISGGVYAVGSAAPAVVIGNAPYAAADLYTFNKTHLDMGDKSVSNMTSLELNGVVYTTLVSGATASGWSGFPATQTVNMAAQAITNILNAQFQQPAGTFTTNKISFGEKVMLQFEYRDGDWYLDTPDVSGFRIREAQFINGLVIGSGVVFRLTQYYPTNSAQVNNYEVYVDTNGFLRMKFP